MGDRHQIEPIFTLTEGIDLANAKKFALCDDVLGYEQLKKTGILCSGDSLTGHAYGNVVQVGQRAAKYHLQQEKLPGILLKEHRRCAKEIISYCNELCYDNQLLALTCEQPCIYPRMGYAHIKGVEQKEGGSRYNVPEAEAIAAWIFKNKSEILATCQADTLAECIAIVTPFSAQCHVLQEALRARNIHLANVGTVHSLQGAEKSMVIFSPVYSADSPEGMFFYDRSANMLNVAVSRAKMSFLVFGDMDIFSPTKGKSPSSLLAKYLFANEENELVDIKQSRFKQVGDSEIQQISSLDAHRYELVNSFVRAQHSLTIVSPFLRLSAIKCDNIVQLIEENIPRIKILIYTDPTLNHGKVEFTQAIELLKKAGAQVCLVNNVHSKIIVIDQAVIIEGSFNWLSASRVMNGYIREESSVSYSGIHVKRFIQAALDPIRNKGGSHVDLSPVS